MFHLKFPSSRGGPKKYRNKAEMKAWKKTTSTLHLKKSQQILGMPNICYVFLQM